MGSPTPWISSINPSAKMHFRTSQGIHRGVVSMWLLSKWQHALDRQSLGVEVSLMEVVLQKPLAIHQSWNLGFKIDKKYLRLMKVPISSQDPSIEPLGWVQPSIFPLGNTSTSSLRAFCWGSPRHGMPIVTKHRSIHLFTKLRTSKINRRKHGWIETPCPQKSHHM